MDPAVPVDARRPDHAAEPAVRADVPGPGVVALDAVDVDRREAGARPRSGADALARRLLRIEDAAPRALVPMRGSLLLSAIRCVITYALIPLLAPFASWLAPVAEPLSLALTLAAMVMAVVSLRRVWLADWNRRWAYTAFVAVVLATLTFLAVLDVRALLT